VLRIASLAGKESGEGRVVVSKVRAGGMREPRWVME